MPKIPTTTAFKKFKSRFSPKRPPTKLNSNKIIAPEIPLIKRVFKMLMETPKALPMTYNNKIPIIAPNIPKNITPHSY